MFPQSQLTSFTNDLMENVYGKEKHTKTVFCMNISQLHLVDLSLLKKYQINRLGQC